MSLVKLILEWRRIVNATTAVRGSAGGCLAALNKSAENPLVGIFTADVQLERVPSMHSEFNDELVLNWSAASNMGPEFYPSLATLLGVDPLTGSWTATLHGNPTSGPQLVLHTAAVVVVTPVEGAAAVGSAKPRAISRLPATKASLKPSAN